MSLLITVFLAVTVTSISTNTNGCLYQKFSPNHSYCKPRNSTCKIHHTGLNDKEKAILLKLHNEYRSKIALGNESRAGGMPTAANMVELEWDCELEKIAQKYAEQCLFAHDCIECRRVERFFFVGQNLHTSQVMKKKASIEEFLKIGIKDFYDEVEFFNKDIVPSYRPITSKDKKGNPAAVWGHFTQVIWATSRLMGCGLVSYKNGIWDVTNLVCNYGPSGNIMNRPVYGVGKPCSACPENTCCGDDCSKFNVKANYKGLCKMHKKDDKC